MRGDGNLTQRRTLKIFAPLPALRGNALKLRQGVFGNSVMRMRIVNFPSRVHARTLCANSWRAHNNAL
jgi:hypothetical protein